MQFLSHMQLRTRSLMPIQPGRLPPCTPFSGGRVVHGLRAGKRKSPEPSMVRGSPITIVQI